MLKAKVGRITFWIGKLFFLDWYNSFKSVFDAQVSTSVYFEAGCLRREKLVAIFTMK